MVLAPKNDRSGFEAAISTFGCTELSFADADAIVPILNPAHVGFVGLSQEAMDIDTDRMLQIFAKMTRAEGGEILTDQHVTGIQRVPNGWQVTTNQGVYDARMLINAAGAWADEIAKLAGVAPVGITPKRRSMARIPAPGGHDLSGWPMLMDVHEQWYAKPDAGKLLVSPADEAPQKPHDAWADDMVLAEGFARYQDFVTEEVTRVENSWAGLRSFAPDKNLVIGAAPEDPQFFWMAGQGGSGIQSAPAYSQYAADLIAGRATEVADITAAVTPARFRT
jgi:glycine/D-amino acid oxidase-like deaminating enzyme